MMENHCLNEWVIESFIQPIRSNGLLIFICTDFQEKHAFLPPLCWILGLFQQQLLYYHDDSMFGRSFPLSLTCESLSDLLVPGRVCPLSPPSALSVCRAICPPAAGASWERPRAGGSSQTACLKRGRGLRWRWMEDLPRMSMDRTEAWTVAFLWFCLYQEMTDAWMNKRVLLKEEQLQIFH